MLRLSLSPDQSLFPLSKDFHIIQRHLALGKSDLLGLIFKTRNRKLGAKLRSAFKKY